MRRRRPAGRLRARLAGAEPLIAVDRDPAKLELALDAWRDTRRRGGLGDDRRPRAPAHRRWRPSTRSRSSAVPETMRLAWDVLRPAGTAVVVGLAPRGVDVSLPAIEFLSDKGIRGSYYGSGDALNDLPGLAELACRRARPCAGRHPRRRARRRRARARAPAPRRRRAHGARRRPGARGALGRRRLSFARLARRRELVGVRDRQPPHGSLVVGLVVAHPPEGGRVGVERRRRGPPA